MTDKTNLIREIHEYVTAHGGENTATHLLVQAASAIQTQAAELEAVGAGGVQALSAAPEAFLKSVIALCSHRGYSPANIEAWDKDDKWIADLWRQAESMLTTSPTPPAEDPIGELVVTKTEDGQIVAVTRQDDEGRILSVIATSDPAEQQAAPKAAPGEQDDHQILAITTAYEQGVGKGHQAYNSGKEIANPYSPAYRCDLAWQYGYKEGKEQAQREAKAAPQQEAQEPTTVDKKTMELAESVGLIGPASRVGDLHAAIQRFHDLICVNATIKAAVMAAEAIGKQQAAPQQEAQEPVAYVEVSQSDAEVSMTWGPEPAGFNLPTGRYALYTSPQPAPAPLSESIDQLERELAIIGVVGAIDGYDVVRRESVLEIARRAALAAQGGSDAK